MRYVLKWPYSGMNQGRYFMSVSSLNMARWTSLQRAAKKFDTRAEAREYAAKWSAGWEPSVVRLVPKKP